MKFKYKILAINIILLSVATAVTGFFMVQKNFKMTLNNQINYALEESNFIQANIEINLLSNIYSSSEAINMLLYEILNNINDGLSNDEVEFNVYLNDEAVSYYSYKDITFDIPVALADKTEYGIKYYSIEYEDGLYNIYTIYHLTLPNNNKLSIITKRNISDVYELKNEQINFYEIMLATVLIISSIIMYIICTLMTKPLSTLAETTEKFADGDFTTRSIIRGTDEIAVLSEKYNYMADSIENHIDELNDMVKRREQFVADFTHEIKTPMTSIIGYADTIRSKELSRQNQIMAADYIFSEGKRLEEMSIKLFDLIYLNNNELTLIPISAATLGADIIKSVAPSFNKAGITISSSFDDALLNGDTYLLQSAFIKLLDNARKATVQAEMSNVEFTGTYDKGNNKYIFKVKDYGIGISEENMKNIYDEFFMVDKSRSRRNGGAGLGLSIVNVILKKHFAEINVSSKYGEFTEFTVVFKDASEVTHNE